MEKVSPDRLMEEMAALALNYPASMIGEDEIVALLPAWITDLGHLTERQFLAAVTEYRQNNKFFPCTADIRETHLALIAREPVKPKLLAIAQAERPADHGQTKKVVALMNEIKRKNPHMSYVAAGKLARQQVTEEPAA